MSVDIIYEKQFIDLKDGRYVPLLLSGSSNCYEYSSNGRERRARNWWLLTPIPRFEHFAPTLNEMLNMCDELRNDLQFQWDDYEDGSFQGRARSTRVSLQVIGQDLVSRKFPVDPRSGGRIAQFASHK